MLIKTESYEIRQLANCKITSKLLLRYKLVKIHLPCSLELSHIRSGCSKIAKQRKTKSYYSLSAAANTAAENWEITTPFTAKLIHHNRSANFKIASSTALILCSKKKKTTPFTAKLIHHNKSANFKIASSTAKLILCSKFAKLHCKNKKTTPFTAKLIYHNKLHILLMVLSLTFPLIFYKNETVLFFQ